MAADVIAASTTMSLWPEKVRAALMVTAQNVDAGYWNATIDGLDGNGVVSGVDAMAFAQGHSEVAPNNTAVQSGIAVDGITASSWNGGYINYNVLIPNPLPAGQHLRIVLTWDSNPDINYGKNDLSDLDLYWNGTVGRNSASYNGNVEVIDVPASETPAGATYQTQIHEYVNRIPSGSFLYYCIAWTFVRDHAHQYGVYPAP